MSRVVLGGGLAGLSATKFLLSAFPKEKVTLVEGSNRTGGWIRSIKNEDGSIFEQGPRTVRPKGKASEATFQLVEALKLEDEVVPILPGHPAAANRLIYCNGKLCPLPTSITSLLFKKEPFSKPLLVHLMKDVIAKKKELKEQDESIYDFTSRRFGSEIADYLVSPMICGICAGNAKEISVRFLFETLFEYEQKHGSVTRGLLSNLLKSSSDEVSRSFLVNKAKGEKWNVYYFKNGMETFTQALTKDITRRGAELQLESNVDDLVLNPNNAEINMGEKTIKTRHVVSSLPAHKLGSIIQKQHPVLAHLLNSIPCVTVGVVNLCYPEPVIEKEGFGFLTSPKENIPILGVIYDSCCRPMGNNSVLTVMMGGHWFEKFFGKSPKEDDLLNTAKDQLRKILNINVEPSRSQTSILTQCIPQYVVGHKERVEQIEKYIVRNNLPLSICGSSYYGVGINDVILSAKNAVMKMTV